MRQYHDLVRGVMERGTYEENRTGVDTIAAFSRSYRIDLADGFPLLTTKDLSGFRWNSLIHELLWYLSGEEHIRNLREETSIWDAWADEEGKLETAYGRFWRRFPVPEEAARLSGEAWSDERWVREEDGRKVFDQIQYVIDTLNGDHPDRDHRSRRMVISAWHPANAAVSTLPPCHYTFAFNVQDGKLNTHLTQRSGDTALGVPFNIAAYALLTHVIANRTGFEPGEFGHTIVDAHIYCGKGDRGRWYAENLAALQERLGQVEDRDGFRDVKAWVEDEAPAEDQAGHDHVPGLLEQLSREPRERPTIRVSGKPLEELEYEDFELADYDPHPGIRFRVAE